MRTETIKAPIATVSITNKREHWSKRSRRAKGQREAAYLLTQLLSKMGLPMTVTLTRIAPRALDDDNLRSALKSVRDGVADRLGIDDRDSRVVWAYGQRKGIPKEIAVEIVASET